MEEKISSLLSRSEHESLAALRIEEKIPALLSRQEQHESLA
jgi:hypothetical protein